MKSVKDVNEVIKQFEELKVLVAPIALGVVNLQTPSANYQSSDSIDINICEGLIYAEYEIYCCGETDHYSIHIPVEYLFDPDWEEKAKAEVKRKKDEAAEKTRLEREARDKAKVDAAYKTYVKLKAQFGDDDVEKSTD